MSNSTSAPISRSTSSPASDIELVAASPAPCQKWKSNYDFLLLDTGRMLQCHIMQHSMTEKKFSELASVLREKSLNFSWRTLQTRFKKLLDDARTEMVEDKKQTGFEQAQSEAQELAAKMIEEINENELMKKVSVLFFSLHTNLHVDGKG